MKYWRYCISSILFLSLSMFGGKDKARSKKRKRTKQTRCKAKTKETPKKNKKTRINPEESGVDQRACVDRNIRFPEVYFSPGNIKDALIRLIKNEKKGIKGSFFVFTHFEIAKALAKQKKEQKIEVDLVVDKNYQRNFCQAIKHLIQHGIPVYSNTLRRKTYYECMHHKYWLFEDQQVIATGSYNPTGAAEEMNYENLIILPSNELFNEFAQEHSRVKAFCTLIRMQDCICSVPKSNFARERNSIPKPFHITRSKTSAIRKKEKKQRA